LPDNQPPTPSSRSRGKLGDADELFVVVVVVALDPVIIGVAIDVSEGEWYNVNLGVSLAAFTNSDTADGGDSFKVRWMVSMSFFFFFLVNETKHNQFICYLERIW